MVILEHAPSLPFERWISRFTHLWSWHHPSLPGLHPFFTSLPLLLLIFLCWSRYHPSLPCLHPFFASSSLHLFKFFPKIFSKNFLGGSSPHCLSHYPAHLQIDTNVNTVHVTMCFDDDVYARVTHNKHVTIGLYKWGFLYVDKELLYLKRSITLNYRWDLEYTQVRVGSVGVPLGRDEAGHSMARWSLWQPNVEQKCLKQPYGWKRHFPTFHMSSRFYHCIPSDLDFPSLTRSALFWCQRMVPLRCCSVYLGLTHSHHFSGQTIGTTCRACLSPTGGPEKWLRRGSHPVSPTPGRWLMRVVGRTSHHTPASHYLHICEPP